MLGRMARMVLQQHHLERMTVQLERVLGQPLLDDLGRPVEGASGRLRRALLLVQLARAMRQRLDLVEGALLAHHQDHLLVALGRMEQRARLQVTVGRLHQGGAALVVALRIAVARGRQLVLVAGDLVVGLPLEQAGLEALLGGTDVRQRLLDATRVGHGWMQWTWTRGVRLIDWRGLLNCSVCGLCWVRSV